MSEFTRCDGPDCDKVRPKRWEDGYYDWPTLYIVEANHDRDSGDFCSWTCLAAWAVNRATEREGTISE